MPGSPQAAPVTPERDLTPRAILEAQLERSEAENRILRDAIGVSADTFKRALKTFGEILEIRDWMTTPEKWKGALREAAEKEFAALNEMVDTDHLPDGRMVVMRVLDVARERDAARADLQRAQDALREALSTVGELRRTVTALMPGDAGRWPAGCPQCGCVGSVDPERM